MERICIDVDGCPIVCWRTGQGPPMICLHGAGMDHHMFDPQLDSLATRGQVIAWDARGHGESGDTGPMSLERWAADLIAILDALGIERATLIGQSLGGYIAQRVWLDAPARVEAMIIIGSTPITPPYPRYEVWALKQSVAMIRWWPFEHFAKTVGRSTALNPDARRYATDAILRMGKQRFMAVWDGVAGAISTRGVPETPPPPPTLLLQGQHDKAGTIARDMPRWAARWPHARLHIIEGAAHNANQDQPEEVNRLILDFLD